MHPNRKLHGSPALQDCRPKQSFPFVPLTWIWQNSYAPVLINPVVDAGRLYFKSISLRFISRFLATVNDGFISPRSLLLPHLLTYYFNLEDKS